MAWPTPPSRPRARGYLTRRLVDVAQDAVVTEYCGTLDGIEVTKLEEGGEVVPGLNERILRRTAREDVYDPRDDETVILRAGDEIDEARVTAAEEAGIEKVVIRSVLTCQTRRGIWAPCDGRDLVRGYRVNMGEAVGVIAAQSIGELMSNACAPSAPAPPSAQRRDEPQDERRSAPAAAPPGWSGPCLAGRARRMQRRGCRGCSLLAR